MTNSLRILWIRASQCWKLAHERFKMKGKWCSKWNYLFNLLMYYILIMVIMIVYVGHQRVYWWSINIDTGRRRVEIDCFVCWVCCSVSFNLFQGWDKVWQSHSHEISSGQGDSEQPIAHVGVTLAFMCTFRACARRGTFSRNFWIFRPPESISSAFWR